MVFVPVAGPPYASGLGGGRRAGTLTDFENFVRLSQSFDVIHSLAPSVEAQDVPIDVRHLVTTRSMIALSDKPLFAYSRGRRIVEETFEMVRIAHGVTPDDFVKRSYCWTNINTNSPRQLDTPMSLGIIDAARAGQACVMTPFTLAGAIAQVPPGGHFFGSDHTLARYEQAFYEPLVFTRQNFGQWTDAGSTTAAQRARSVAQQTLAAYGPPPIDDAMLAELDDFVGRRIAEGGAAPD